MQILKNTAVVMVTSMGLSALAGKIGIVFETSKPKIVWWQFLFWKTLSALETIFTLIRPLHLTTLAFVKEKNNGFAGNDRQETRIFVYSVDFVQFLPGANFAGGTFEDSPDWHNICKIAANYPHFFSTLTTRYSFVISSTFTSKTVPGVVWNADTFFTARVQFARLADTL